VSFQGEVSLVDDQQGLLPGFDGSSSFSGTIVYNVVVSGIGDASERSYTYDTLAPTGMSASLSLASGLFEFHNVVPGALTNDDAQLTIRNDDAAGFGGLSDKIDINVHAFAQTAGETVPDVEQYFFRIEQSSSDLSTLSGVVPAPASAFSDLSAYDEQNDFSFLVRQSSSTFSVQGSVATIEAIPLPEPSVLLLLGSGALEILQTEGHVAFSSFADGRKHLDRPCKNLISRTGVAQDDSFYAPLKGVRNSFA